MGENHKDQLREEELLEKLAEEAEKIEVPDSLKPEIVKEKLKTNKKVHRKIYYRSFVAAAAALVIIIGGAGAMQISQDSGLQIGKKEAVSDEPDSKDAEEHAADQSYAEDKVVIAKNETVGDDYHIVKDYEEIYQMYRSLIDERKQTVKDAMLESAVTGIIKYNSKDKMNMDAEYSGANLESAEEIAENDVVSSDTAADGISEKDYSETNVMEEGVDESDIIKTDGKYIYTCKDKEVGIVDISGKKMETVGTIKPDMGDMETIRELYVAEDRLYIIAEKLDNTEVDNGTEKECYDLAYTNIETGVILLTYDITDPSSPKILGDVEQEGAYQTSRKVDDYIYLFTEKYPYDCDNEENLIPKIDGKKVSADCIYLSETIGDQELIVSSINVNKPDESMDQLVVFSNYAGVYMSTDSMYIYGSDWSGDYEITRIAKFDYHDGVLNGKDSTFVKGFIQDEFAIHESDGCLQVLTTDWSSEVSKNQLYLFDKNMKLTGSLEEIAAGEEIYAARYIGDIAYFITYHNTDPLFAVDISDPSNPKMLDHIEITGFSDYLHPYGDNLLLGIGYETDPETSETLGVKLTMFDISNPSDLKILDTVVAEGAIYTTAAKNYKSVLASESKNLIGFEVENWKQFNDEQGGWLRDEYKYYYKVYQWIDGNFVKVFNKEIPEEESSYTSYIRGLYSGNRFYLVTRNCLDGKYHIRSFDMEKDYELINEIVY